MTRFIISGCNGKMGNQIAAGLKTRPNCITVAGIDAFTGVEKEFPVFSTPAEISCEADVLIDFSNPSLLCWSWGFPVKCPWLSAPRAIRRIRWLKSKELPKASRSFTPAICPLG